MTARVPKGMEASCSSAVARKPARASAVISGLSLKRTVGSRWGSARGLRVPNGCCSPMWVMGILRSFGGGKGWRGGRRGEGRREREEREPGAKSPLSGPSQLSSRPS